MNKLTKKFSILLASVAMATGVGLVGSAESNVAKADSETLTLSSFSGDTKSRSASLTSVDVLWEKLSSSNNITDYDPMRIYVGHQMTFTPKAGYKINSVVATQDSGNRGKYAVLDTATLTNASIEVNGVEATITPTSSTDSFKLKMTKQTRISKFVINYSSASSETADAFLAAVAAIPSLDELTVADKDLVEAARKEYGYLIDTLKAQEDVVAALATLEAAEAKIAELEKAAQDKADVTAAAEVDALINAIGEVTDYSKADQIKAARKAYEALNDNAKAKVTTLETLVAAETALAEYAPLVSEFVAADLGLKSETVLTTYTVNKITYTFTKATGSNDPKYYDNNNGKTARCYANNQLIIQGSTEVGAITSITFTAASTWGGVTVSPASEISGSRPYVITVGFATNTVVITFSGKSFITNISVAYTKATTEQIAANEFIAKWNVYSADYCTNMTDETKRAEILALIAEYEALDANVKAIVDANIDLTGTEMAKTIEYAKNYINFLNGTATGEGSTGTVLSAVTESGASTIAIVAALVLLTFVGYVVISKKKIS